MRNPLFALVLAVILFGCAATPRGAYVTAQDSYNEVASVFVDARESGLISEETYQAEILPLINRGDQVLDVIDLATRAGQTPLPSDVAALRQIADKLIDARLKYLRENR